jgi:hypothetical protein
MLPISHCIQPDWFAGSDSMILFTKQDNALRMFRCTKKLQRNRELKPCDLMLNGDSSQNIHEKTKDTPRSLMTNEESKIERLYRPLLRRWAPLKYCENELLGLIGVSEGVWTGVIPSRHSPTRRKRPWSARRVSLLRSRLRRSTARG